jgi:hypothetical protein
MRACILVFYIALFAVTASAQNDPDALYRDRADLLKAQAASRLWEQRVAADPHDFESAWKIARGAYWLGTHLPQSERRAALERGLDAGRQASMLEPSKPEGFFWMAADMGALAESFGLRQGLRYRGAIKDALETVLRLDPAFQDGSADRALGRWYFKVPALFGGSKTRSEEHLRKSLTYNPESIASHVFLAETLTALGRRTEATEELRRAVAAPIASEWAPEDREFQMQAQARLAGSVQ